MTSHLHQVAEVFRSSALRTPGTTLSTEFHGEIESKRINIAHDGPSGVADNCWRDRSHRYRGHDRRLAFPSSPMATALEAAWGEHPIAPQDLTLYRGVRMGPDCLRNPRWLCFQPHRLPLPPEAPLPSQAIWFHAVGAECCQGSDEVRNQQPK